LNQLTPSKITPKYVVDNYLIGIPLYDKQGNPFPTTTIQIYINNNLSYLETFLRVAFRKKIIKSEPVDDGLLLGIDYHEMIRRQPFDQKEALNFYKIKLPHRNVYSVERIRAWILTQQYTFDSESYRIQWPKEGVIHVFPSAVFLGAIGGSIMYQTPMQYPLSTVSSMPCFWAIDYTVTPPWGSVDDGGLEDKLESDTYYMPDELAEWVCKKASINVLSLASPTPGVVSRSFNIDGISRNVTTSESKDYGMYTSIMKRYEEDLKGINLKAYRKKFNGLSVL